MRENYIIPSDVRVNNVKQFINDKYDGSSNTFYKDFKCGLKKLKYTDEGIESKTKQLRNALGNYKGKTFSEALEKVVQKAFDLPIGIISHVREKRIPAYIFISCTGNSVEALFSEVKKIEIVDEIVILFGDVDVFIKVYATKSELETFITENIYKIEGVSISRTKTYSSLEEKSWVKYPVNEHPNYKPPPNRWSK